MAWGTMQVGALLLKETDILEDVTNANTGERTVRWEGAETAPSSATQAAIAARQADIMGLIGRILPVKFERKTEYNGYYQFTDTNTVLEKWQQGPAQIRWGLAAQFLGPDNVVDIESRMANVVRLNDFVLAGERWHAPAATHYGYHVGAVSPAQLVRQTDTGPITVYRSIPAGVNPRWGATVAGYQTGRVRFLSAGVERVSPRIPCGTTDWEMNNGLVRVRPNPTAGTSTTLLIAVWDGTVWREKAWDVRIQGDTLVPPTHFTALTVTRLDPECVSLRIVAAQPTGGQRVLLDLLMRRGSRFVEGYVQRTTSGTLSVQLDVLEDWTDNNSYVIASGEDSTGIRYAAGSSRAFDPATNGGVSDANNVKLDFWIGAEVPMPSVGGGNPGFETGSLTPWFTTNGTPTIRSGDAKHGTYYGRVTATVAATEIRIVHSETATPGVPGRAYTISGWIRSPVPVTAGQAFIQMSWYNGAALLSGSQILAPALLANVWTPVIGTATAPANTNLIARSAGVKGTSVVVGTLLDVDSVQVREPTPSGDVATDFVQQYLGAMAEKVGVARR